MNFNSIEYLLFIPLLFLCLNLTGRRWRWLVLLGGSFYFYLTLKHLYLILALLFVTGASWCCGLLLARFPEGKGRRAIFWSGVAANLLALVALKYLPFLERNLNLLLGSVAPRLSVPEGRVLVSIGVSYFVFQAISYLIDVYLEIEGPERHPGYFALYLAFFPKLLQGPIERAGDLLPQLRQETDYDHDDIRAGLLLFGWGLLKKAVIADRLALYVNAVYGDLHAHSGLALLFAGYLYAFQLYFDFAGYTDMALGTARLFGIRLTQNFDAPYRSRSISEFWRRWHISFSRWILDYIFKPLQMQLRDWKTAGTAVALLVTFLASGIWHGASWCFVIWGGLHGIYLAASVLYKPYQKRIHQRLGVGNGWLLRCWQTLVTFHLVCFAWIFFRSPTVADAWYVITHLFAGTAGLDRLLALQGRSDLVIAGVAALGVWVVSLARERLEWGRSFWQGPALLRWGVYLCLAVAVLFFNMDSNAGFIYFNF